MEEVVEENFKGYWGQPTATIDWCEANYEVTYWIAEFWNTVSNLSMIIPPLLGFVFGLKDGVELRYTLAYLAVMCVGVGSWLFHGTLLYQCQLLDELPMIWGSAVLIYCLKEANSPPKGINPGLIALLTTYCVVVTLVYVTINMPVFFQTAYALMVCTMIYYSVKLSRHYKNLSYMFILSFVIYGTGFLLWNLDNLYCGTFRYLRRRMIFPLKPFFQGHAWWHVLAGLGTHISILFSLNARVNYLKQDPHVYMPMGLPTIVRVQPRRH